MKTEIKPEVVKQIKDLGEQITASLNKIEAAKASMPVTGATVDDLSAVYRSLYSSIDYLNQRIGYIWDAIYAHQDGHLPKTNGVEQMSRAVAALGLDKEYQVAPKVIYANGNRGEQTASIRIK